MTLIFAHRGSSSTHPENTMGAFLAAEEAGADGIELDVHLTKDGRLAVIHDETVDRTTNGTGKVRDFTMAELKRLKANYHWRHFFKKTERIPDLEEVFDWLEGNGLLLNIELKNNVIRYEGLEEKVVAGIRERGFEERIIISSFNHYSLAHIADIAPEIETAPLYNVIMYKPWEYALSMKAAGIHPKLAAAPPEVIQETLGNGIAVRPYTVNREKDMRKLFELGASAIITDVPQKAVRIRDGGAT